jgi:hypothetical protein
MGTWFMQALRACIGLLQRNHTHLDIQYPVLFDGFLRNGNRTATKDALVTTKEKGLSPFLS